MKINKRKSTKIGVREACRGRSHCPTARCQLPQTGGVPITQTGRCQLLTPAGGEVPCAPKQEAQLLYRPSRGKEDFLLVLQQAQPMENTTAQPVRSQWHLNFCFPPMNFHFFLADNFVSLSHPPYYKSLPCCVTSRNICLPYRMLPNS